MDKIANETFKNVKRITDYRYQENKGKFLSSKK